MINISKDRFEEIVKKFHDKKILVIGDLMIDQYLMGEVKRISPEAPVPVIEVTGENLRFGGAANVAKNILSLGCKPILAGVVGTDRMGEQFINILKQKNMDDGAIIQQSDRPTTVKTRIIGQSQHVARVDRESREYLNKNAEIKILEKIKSVLPDISAIIIEDYNKGVLTKSIIEKVIELAKKYNILITVDPKFQNFMEYKNVTVFKPNIKETEEALAIDIQNISDLENAGQSLIKKLNVENVLITRGSEGISLFSNDGSITHAPTRARDIADVSGAGDTVISTLTAAMVGSASCKEGITLANHAAGIVCGELGIVPIAVDQLRNACCGEDF